MAKWLFLGDDYDYWLGADGWIAKFCEMKNIDVGNSIIKISDTGFGADEWKNTIKEMVDKQTLNPKNIAHIVIGGGYFDAYRSSVDSIDELFQYIKNNFSGAKKYFAYIGWCLNTMGDQNGRVNSYKRYLMQNIWIKKCKEYDITYLAGCEMAIRDRSLLNSNGWLPNSNGSQKIAEAINAAILRAEENEDFFIEKTQSVNKSIILTNGQLGGTIQQTIKNNKSQLIFSNAKISNCNFSLISWTPTKIATIKLPFSNSFSAFMPITIKGENNLKGTHNCLMYVNKDELYIILMDDIYHTIITTEIGPITTSIFTDLYFD